MVNFDVLITYYLFITFSCWMLCMHETILYLLIKKLNINVVLFDETIL